MENNVAKSLCVGPRTQVSLFFFFYEAGTAGVLCDALRLVHIPFVVNV